MCSTEYRPLSSSEDITGLHTPAATWRASPNQTGTGPVIGLNFEGISATGGNVDPDADIAVGATQVVQVANPKFAVYDKSTGALLGGPYMRNGTVEQRRRTLLNVCRRRYDHRLRQSRKSMGDFTARLTYRRAFL